MPRLDDRPQAPVARRSALASRLAGPLAAAGVGLAGMAVLLRVDPHSGIPFLPPCPLHALTGIDCPGCGATRATWDLLHGDVARAWSENAMIFLFLPLLVIGWVLWLMSEIRDRPIMRFPLRAAIAFLVLMGIWMLARNIWWPLPN